jgi:tRNA-specific 2-thiouridylase
MKKKVVIGLSGGVDSSVAAWILKEQGYEVTGLFMRNWNDNTGVLEADCTYEDDVMFAEMVAARIGIPFYVVDLSEPYRKRVVDYMFSEYQAGRTPNPDILCNREIKFDSFVTEARKIGGELVATGHYCRKELLEGANAKLPVVGDNSKNTIDDEDRGTEQVGQHDAENMDAYHIDIKEHSENIVYRLLAGKDPGKDQSYFLCQITQDQLAGALFPIGNMTKQEVRKLASDLNMPTAERKDSQGICFIGKVDLPTFLQQKLKPRTGRTVLIPATEEFPVFADGLPPDETGDEVLDAMSSPYSFNPSGGPTIGKHDGAHYFTVGQRKGINIGGYKKPLFVLATDSEKNILYVGEGQDHPGLHRKGLLVRDEDIHWIRPGMQMAKGENRVYDVRIRYRQPLEKAKLFRRDRGMYVIFERLQRGIAPGQFAAWYSGDELLGSGVISS